MAKITSSSDYQRELRKIFSELRYSDGTPLAELPDALDDYVESVLDLNERAFDASTSFINAQSILSKPIKESDK